ncbi:uncharacterized protein [Ptychodera flava]|uniref:uncharacterized protein n=1 Tax=Ptychodera flava TaxID=63121 RepID=UPI00396AAFDD
MASGQSSEGHAGEAERKKRRVDTRDRDYHTLSGETNAGVSPDLTGSEILAGRGYQRQQYSPTHTISSNYDSWSDTFNMPTRQTYFPQQHTHAVSPDLMETGSQAAARQDYQRLHYPAYQSVPSNYENQSDSFNVLQSNLPSQITQEYLHNPIRSGLQSWPDHSRQVETQMTPLHYESLLGNSFNTQQSGQEPHGKIMYIVHKS